MTTQILHIVRTSHKKMAQHYHDFFSRHTPHSSGKATLIVALHLESVLRRESNLLSDPPSYEIGKFRFQHHW